TIDTAAIADTAFLCRRNGCKTGSFQDRTHQAVPQKIRSIQAVWTKKCRALDRARSDHTTQGRQSLRSMAHRPHGDRSREQIPSGHALPVKPIQHIKNIFLMTSYKSNTPHDEPLTIVTLLKALGHEPVSTGSDEYQYASVFGNRTNNKIVLTVNNRLNTWFDRSLGLLGKGGNFMDFARTYWPDLSTEQIEEKLRGIQRRSAKKDRPLRKRKATKIPHYQID